MDDRLTEDEIEMIDEGNCPKCGNPISYNCTGPEKYFCDHCDFEIDEMDLECQR